MVQILGSKVKVKVTLSRPMRPALDADIEFSFLVLDDVVFVSLLLL